MKQLSSIGVIILLLIVSACKKSESVSVTVIRDCTGTYLQINGKDFQVCNLEKVASFSDGQTATASYKRISECNGSAKDAIVCFMLHANEGWIEVEKIK